MRPLPASALITCLPLVALLIVAGCDKAKHAPEQANASAGTARIGPSGGAPAALTLGPDGYVLDRGHRGMSIPALPFAAPGGAPATLTQFRGHPLLVNMWATWCGPCVKELPTLDALAAKPGAPKVVAVSEDMGGDKQVQPFWKTHGLKTLTAYTDSKMGMMNALQVDVLPTTIFYDSEGREVWRVVGGRDWSAADVTPLLAEAK